MGRTPGKHLSPSAREQLRQAVIEAAGSDTNLSEVAEKFGVSRSTIYAMNRELRTESVKLETEATIELPDFLAEDDGEEPVEEVIGRLSRNFVRAKTAHDKRKWFRIGIKDNKPIGILGMGDPHLDDNGCNWPVLQRHAELCRTTPGLYAVNIGDTTNCWGGRLVRLYANQDTSVRTARRLAEWLLLGSGIKWFLWLWGNHETMGDGGPLLEEMNRRYGTQTVPMMDWRADFVIAFPNGQEFRVSCAHDFPGNSMWNPNHGAVKAARFGNEIDVLICGHKHNWAISQWELAEQGCAPLMVRTRGYKHLDEYAARIGAHEQEEGQAILVVFDPAAKSKSGRVMAFVDVEAGVEYLSHLRSRDA